MPVVDFVCRAAAGALLVVLGLALSACLLSPGKFTSALDIRKDGQFSFTYAGEIHLLALSKLAEMGRDTGTGETFTPKPCTVPGNDAKRICSPREVAEQKRQWQETQTDAAAKRRRDSVSMKAMLGGIDPSNPRAAEELAERLRRQVGWRRVAYKGDGLFEVDFAITGRLDHDFAFPTIERFPMANAFVQLALRGDGSVRVDAPGFAPAADGGPWRGMMAAAAASGGKEMMPALAQIDGTFTVTSDGLILANNTEEGPQAAQSGQRLDWKITPRNSAAPMALIRLAS